MKNDLVTSRVLVRPPVQSGTLTRLEGELHLPKGEMFKVFFEFTTPSNQPAPLRARPFLLAFLLPAMQAGAPLELALPVDATTRNNLMEYQEALASWHPKILKVIPIVAPWPVQPELPGKMGALTAFSGGDRKSTR